MNSPNNAHVPLQTYVASSLLNLVAQKLHSRPSAALCASIVCILSCGALCVAAALEQFYLGVSDVLFEIKKSI
jgi:hypothetical protein